MYLLLRLKPVPSNTITRGARATSDQGRAAGAQLPQPLSGHEVDEVRDPDRFALAGLRVLSQDLPDLVKNRTLPLLRQHGDVADASKPVDDVGVGADVHVREGCPSPARPQAVRDVSQVRLAPAQRSVRAARAAPGQIASMILPWRMPFYPVHHRPDRVDPADAAVAHVPDQPEPPADLDDPRELGQSPVGVEPVECLRDHYRVE